MCIRDSILIIPKKHLKSMLELTDDDTIASHLFTVARKLAKEHHLEENGFRVVINTGKDGGQTVEHLHLHLLGGPLSVYSLQLPPFNSYLQNSIWLSMEMLSFLSTDCLA